MTHKTDATPQTTPQWALVAVEALGFYLDREKHESGRSTVAVWWEDKATLAAIIASHAPDIKTGLAIRLNHELVECHKELHSAQDYWYNERQIVAAKDAEIERLRADNQHLHDVVNGRGAVTLADIGPKAYGRETR